MKLSVTLLLLASVVPTNALAQSPSAGTSPSAQASARLKYGRAVGVEHCPDEEQFRALLAARLGYDPITANGDMRVAASIALRGGRLQGHVDLHDASGAPRGKRDLSSAKDDCGELASSMALAIGIAIDPLSLTRPVAPKPPAPTVQAERQPSVLPVAPPHIEPLRDAIAPASPSTLTLRMGIGGLGTVGASPTPALGGALFVGMGWRSFTLDVEGRAQTSSTEPASQGAVHASMLLATLAPCMHFGPAITCVLASAGSVQANGSGVAFQRSDSAAYAALGARIGAEHFFSKMLGARVHADVLASPTRVSLNLNDTTVWTTPVLSGALGADLLARF